MNPRGKKLEPKLGIKMPFAELVERLIQTDPKEVEKSVQTAKQKTRPKSKASKKRQKRGGSRGGGGRVGAAPICGENDCR